MKRCPPAWRCQSDGNYERSGGKKKMWWMFWKKKEEVKPKPIEWDYVTVSYLGVSDIMPLRRDLKYFIDRNDTNQLEICNKEGNKWWVHLKEYTKAERKVIHNAFYKAIKEHNDGI